MLLCQELCVDYVCCIYYRQRSTICTTIIQVCQTDILPDHKKVFQPLLSFDSFMSVSYWQKIELPWVPQAGPGTCILKAMLCMNKDLLIDFKIGMQEQQRKVLNKQSML